MELYDFIIIGSIIVAASAANFTLLTILMRKQRHLKEQFAQHHRIIATVAPMIGLVRLLQESDGHDFDTVQKGAVYTAFDRTVADFHRALGVEPPEAFYKVEVAG